MHRIGGKGRPPPGDNGVRITENEKNKHKSMEFSIRDNGTYVEAQLFIDGKQVLDYTNEEAKPVKVIAPLLNKTTFWDNLCHFAKHDPHKKTVEQQFDFYMSCRELDVFDQVQEIRKAIKRISRQLENVALAKKFILLIGIPIFCFFINYGYAFGAGISEFNKKYEFITEEHGVQRLYLDTKNIIRDNNIAKINMINLFIKGGKLYQVYKSQFPKQSPSHAISKMEFNCKSMEMRVNEFKLYNNADEIITSYSIDKKWTQVQIKNMTDKFIFETACK